MYTTNHLIARNQVLIFHSINLRRLIVAAQTQLTVNFFCTELSLIY